mmetsp:Transcript_4907/g.17035  ORF Transcript_4907/g.17035 Transcript_4907/m.17035 type:complete len:298 (-) Transcript_4907:2299-3192(-)
MSPVRARAVLEGREDARPVTVVAFRTRGVGRRGRGRGRPARGRERRERKAVAADVGGGRGCAHGEGARLRASPGFGAVAAAPAPVGGARAAPAVVHARGQPTRPSAASAASIAAAVRRPRRAPHARRRAPPRLRLVELAPRGRTRIVPARAVRRTHSRCCRTASVVVVGASVVERRELAELRREPRHLVPPGNLVLAEVEVVIAAATEGRAPNLCEGYPLRGVLLEHAPEQLLDVPREPVRARKVALLDEVDGGMLGRAFEGEEAGEHLVEDDAERPDVDGGAAVLFAAQNLHGGKL